MNETTSLLTGKGNPNKDGNQTTEKEDGIGPGRPFKLGAVGVVVVVVVVCLFSSSNSSRSNSGPFESAVARQPPVRRGEALFMLSQEQNLELWDHWKEYLSWQDIWNEAHDTWNDAQQKGREAWDEARKEADQAWDDAEQQAEQAWYDAQEKGSEAWDEAQEEADQAWDDAEKQAEQAWDEAEEEANNAWEEAKARWDETNFTEMFYPNEIARHTRLWSDLTPEEGQTWWEDATNYYNDLSSSVVQNDILWIHTYGHSRNKHRLSHRHDKNAAKKSVNVYMNHSDAFLMLLDHTRKGGLYHYSMDYFLLNQGLDAQINQAYCAVATSVAVLNSLRGHINLPQDPIYDPYPYATQIDAFDECTDANVKVKNETFDGVLSAPFGLNLDSAKSLLECHLPSDEWKVEAFHVDADISPSHMRGQMKDALTNPTSRVIINYHRAIAGQMGGGHFSPIGSYNPDTDSFLIMDVAKYKYPPVWISTEKLYQSLFATDSCGHWRGPAAQASMPPDLLHPTTVKELAAAMAMLGCRAAPRGFIIVSKRR